jgi:hypothetical protein
VQAEPVNAERQILRHVMSVRANREGSPKLISLTREFTGRREGGTLCVVHFEAQLAADALGVRA